MKVLGVISEPREGLLRDRGGYLGHISLQLVAHQWTKSSPAVALVCVEHVCNPGLWLPVKTLLGDLRPDTAIRKLHNTPLKLTLKHIFTNLCKVVNTVLLASG